MTEPFAPSAMSTILTALVLLAALALPARADLLFHATFDDDSAVAIKAKGAAEPVDAKRLEWTEGVRGRAVRLTHKEGSLLSYATPGNVPMERGTVSLWAKCEWEKPHAFRVLFSHRRIPSGRLGTHALMLWWHNQTLRSDVSDDKDSWQSSVPAGALDGRWHHYAFSWDPNGMAAYVDGRSVGRGGDSDSPMKTALRAADNGGALYRFSKPTEFDRFYLGSRDDGSQWDGVIDEVRIYDTPLAPAQIAKLAAEFGPPPAPSKPDYAALYARNEGNPYVGAPAATPGVIPDDDLELVDEVRLGSPEDIERLRAAERIRTIGELSFGEAGGLPYLELGAKRGNRMALRFTLPEDGARFYVFDIDYPDDKVRTMDCIVQTAKGGVSSGGDYAMQCGIAAGAEYPNTGRVLTHRVIWWRSPGEAAVVLTTTRDKAPAAVAAVRLWRVKSGTLPPFKPFPAALQPEGQFPAAIGGNLQPEGPFPAAAGGHLIPESGYHRSIGLYYEDPALGYDFAVPGGLATPESMGETIDRAIATMRFTGENMLFYPGAWYAGLIDETYTPRPHAPDFLSGWYAKFDAEGDFFLVPTLNINNMPVPPGLVTMDSMTNGALHASPIAIHDTGLPNWGKWHGTPPNFNIAHPEVRRWLAGIVDRLVEQGAPHPSFKGVCLHVTRHGLLTWGGIESGYNDYCIDAFAKATGIRIPVDRSDPLRGKAYADWLKAHPEAMEKWLDWRCRVVAGFWGDIANRMRARRPDLKLWINCGTTSFIKHEYVGEPDFIARANREVGIDAAKLDAAAPNLVLAQCIVPADWRWRGNGLEPKFREAQRTLVDSEATYALLRDAARPWVAQHDRYWESAIGRGKGADGKEVATLSCAWLNELGWRVSTINPAGANSLRPFVLPLRYNDVLGMTKGGFLIGTYGTEPYLARFARAFRALPAVKMDEFFREGVVVGRMAVVEGRTWGYVVNTDVAPAEVDPEIPPGAMNAATGEALSARLALGPYEMVSFLLP